MKNPPSKLNFAIRTFFSLSALLVVGVIATGCQSEDIEVTPAPAATSTPVATQQPDATPVPVDPPTPVATRLPDATEIPVATETPAPIENAAPQFIESPDCESLNHEYLPLTDLTLSTGDLTVAVQVEVAANPSERTQGLMCRESLPWGTGMLFTYAADRNTGFWMYNTYVPIEILYIDHSGDVVDKITMSPCLRETASDDEWIAKCAAESAAYVPGGSWRYTLELPVGWLAAQGADDSMIQEMNVSGPAIVQ